MGSEASRPSTRKNPPPPDPTVLRHRRRKMGPASCLVEWLKPDCMCPNKKKKKRTPPSPTSTAAAAAAGDQIPATAQRKPRSSSGSTFLTLEEHLSSTSSPPIGLTRPDPGGVRKPSPKRIHPASSSASSSGSEGRRRRKGKGSSFTLETLVKLDRESKDDYFSGSSNARGNLVSGEGAAVVGSGSGPAAGSRSCRRERSKKQKSVRFTLPGDGDVFVFYSPRAPIDRPFHSL